MIFGTASLASAFVVLGSLLLWLFINPFSRTIVKIIVIPAVIWFGLVAWYAPRNLMGWSFPTKIEGVPENSIVKGVVINEPYRGGAGNICFWIIPMTEEIENILLNPKTITVPKVTQDEPRSYKVPYSKELHQKLADAQKEREEMKGGVLLFKGLLGKRGKSKRGTAADSEAEFEVLNPHRVLRKD